MKSKYLIILFSLVVFFLGLYVYCTGKFQIIDENLENRKKVAPKCGNVLVKRGEHIYLYNTTDRSDAMPVHFNNLDEYIEYVKQQRAQGLNCPILFLQEESDVQGNDVYRVRPSPFDLQGGMQPINSVNEVVDASRISKKYNKNLYPGFDPYGYDIGTYNELDAIHSYMIVKNGMVVSEGWWDPYGPNDPHLLYSLTKAYISTAVGFAVQENLLSVEDFVISFFPEYVPKNLNWNMQNLRVSDLLTFSTGHVGPVLKNKTRVEISTQLKKLI